MMRLLRFKTLGLILLLAMITVSACREPVSTSSKSECNYVKEETSKKQQSVGVVNPALRSFKADILISGTAMPNKKAKVHAMESGYLQSLSNDIGDKVSKGQSLARLENPEITQFLAQAESDIAVKNAEIEMLRADIISAQATEKMKSSLYNRLSKIHKETPQLSPIAELEKAEGEASIAKAQISALQSRINAKQKQIGGLQKQLEFANARLEMLSIKAPFSGVITKRFLDQGTMVQSALSNSSAQAVFEIQDLDPIRLTLPIPESDAAAIKKGMTVIIDFPELSGGTFESKVSRTSGSLDESSKTMDVQIDIANKDKRILTGMYAKAKMKLDSRDNVLSLPITAIKLIGDLPHVLVVDGEEVKSIALRKGLTGKDYFEVLNADLNKETKVIIQGKNLVKPGDLVKAVMQY